MFIDQRPVASDYYRVCARLRPSRETGADRAKFGRIHTLLVRRGDRPPITKLAGRDVPTHQVPPAS